MGVAPCDGPGVASGGGFAIPGLGQRETLGDAGSGLEAFGEKVHTIGVAF